MIPLPPLNFNGGSATGGTVAGSGAGNTNSGAWNVNLGGSGTSYQNASSGLGAVSPLVWAAIALGAWWLLRR